MKSTPKRILSLFMSLLMLLSVTSGLTFTSFAAADVSFEYTENDDGTINITGFTAGEDSTGNLDIPSKIDGKTVTGIDDSVLNGYYESVTIPGTITSELSYSTFVNLYELKMITVNENNPAYSSVDGVLFNKDITVLIRCPIGKTGILAIPDGVKHFADNALYWCPSLAEITIPSSLERSDGNGNYYLTGYDFYNCSSLERITVDENNKDFASSAGGELLNKNKTELICCPKTKAGTYSISEGITKVEMNAFSDCNSITEIVIPSSLTDIDYGGYTFSRCDNLKKITVEANNEYFSSVDGVLYSKDKSVLITYPKNKDLIVIPDFVREIGARAFEDRNNLTDIIIPDTVTKIGDEAFNGCDNLSQISFPSGLTSIGCDVFGYTAYYYDENNWENGCLYLDNYLLDYENNNGAESVSIKDSTVLIADYAFDGENEITQIAMHDSVKYIGRYAFSQCGSLTSVTLSENTEDIGDYAFFGCPGLKSITVPASVKTIGDDSLVYVGEDVRTPIDVFTIYGYRGTAARTYARENGFNFVNLDGGSSADFDYSENEDGTIRITDFYPDDDSTGALEIPSEIDGKTVTGIEPCILEGNYESVTIPETIISGLDGWDEGSFYSLHNLKDIIVDENNPEYSSVDGVLFNKDKTVLICCPQAKSGEYYVPEGVEGLNGFSFNYCVSLEKISFPASLEQPYVGTFTGCNSLICIDVNEDNEYISSIDGVLFNKDQTSLLFYPKAKQSLTYTVPDGVAIIGYSAFQGNEILNKVIIPDTVNVIIDWAFANNTALSEIVMPRGIVRIGDNAFYDTQFYNDRSNWENGYLYMDEYLVGFRQDDNVITEVNIKDGTVLISDYLFCGNGNIKNVYLPDTLKYIGDSAFQACLALESISIPDSVEYLGEQVFFGCNSLKDLKLSNSIESIGTNAFRECVSLESVVIPDSVVYLGWSAFEGNDALREVVLSENLEYVDSYCFKNCPNLKSIRIPKSVTEIASNAFGFYDKYDETDDLWYNEKIDGFTIYGYKNTAAEEYANENGFTFVDLDSSECAHKNTVVKNTVSATCTTAGYTGDTYCADCNTKIAEGKTIPALGHKSETVKGKSATCTEKGLTDGTKCSVCGVTLIAQKPIPALGHKSETIKGKPATCTESGLTDGEKCSVCGKVIKEQSEIPSLGHKSEVITGKPATCTETGLTDGEKCSVCGTVIKEQSEIPAIGHKAETVKGKSATCTEKGLTDGEKCSVCGKVIKEQTEIPALGHTSEVVKGKPATCTESGLTDGTKCSVCGVTLIAQKPIPALGHKSETVKGKNATCTEKGLTDGEKCSVCGIVIKEQAEIPSLGHTSEVITGKNAICTETGLTDGEKCSVCGEVIKAQSEIPALGHTFENGVCIVCGAKDPDFKLVLAENHDKNITLDNEKKTVTSVPASVNGMTAGELKSQFGAQIELDLDDSALVPNGTKFKYNGEEYTIIVKGDVSADGKITAADARALLRIAAKLDNPDDVTSTAADIDSNGKITSTEARNILRFAARLSSTIDG